MTSRIQEIANNLRNVVVSRADAYGAERMTVQEQQEHGSLFAVWQPGDATRYPFIISDLSGLSFGCGSGTLQFTLMWEVPATFVTDHVLYRSDIRAPKECRISNYTAHMICAFSALAFGLQERAKVCMESARDES